MIAENILESITLPSIIKLSHNLHIISFQNMKILPAKFIIERAIKNNLINNKTKIVETSSGSFAYGLALVCNVYGLECHIVSDPYMDSDLKSRIEILGAKVHMVKRTQGLSSQEVRLNFLYDLISKFDNYFWTSQYDNIDNPNSYEAIGKKIIDLFPNQSELILVGSVGSGGSTCGLAKSIRMHKAATLVGVDCFNSVIFKLNPGERKLGGGGNGIIPKNVNHSLYDQIHWLSDEYCIYGMQSLYKEKGIFCGHTTGAAYIVASFIAQSKPDSSVIFISPDSGNRYLSTYYNNEWLLSNEIVPPLTIIDYPYNTSTPSLAKNLGLVSIGRGDLMIKIILNLELA